MSRRELYAWIIGGAILLALFGRPPLADAERVPTLYCNEARAAARWVLRQQWPRRLERAREKHVVCERPRINRTRWRTRYGIWAGGAWVFYGTVTVWRWPHDPERFAYWISPHLMRHR